MSDKKQNRILFNLNLTDYAGNKLMNETGCSLAEHGPKPVSKTVGKPGEKVLQKPDLYLGSLVAGWLKRGFKVISIKLFKKTRSGFKLQVILTNEAIDSAFEINDPLYRSVMALLLNGLWSTQVYHNEDGTDENGLGLGMYVVNLINQVPQRAECKTLAYDQSSGVFAVN